MTKSTDIIRFKAKLLRPATPKNATWAFLVLPASASAKLPTRAMTSVEGTLEGHPFKATLEPDGQGSHWLKVAGAMQKAAGVGAGDTVALEIAPASEEVEARVPADLRKALAAAPEARALWDGLTPVATRLGSVDRVREEGRNARATRRQHPRHARIRQASRVLLRSVGDLQQGVGGSEGGGVSRGG